MCISATRSASPVLYSCFQFPSPAPGFDSQHARGTTHLGPSRSVPRRAQTRLRPKRARRAAAAGPAAQRAPGRVRRRLPALWRRRWRLSAAPNPQCAALARARGGRARRACTQRRSLRARRARRPRWRASGSACVFCAWVSSGAYTQCLYPMCVCGANLFRNTGTTRELVRAGLFGVSTHTARAAPWP